MSKETSKKGKKCGSRKNVMITYGVLQLGSNLISAIALVTIAFNLYSPNKQSKSFNDCVQEQESIGKTVSDSVRFCSGGK